MKFTMNAQVPDGTVLLMGIRYDGQTSDKVFTYAWLKAGGLWYSTGNARVPTAAGWGAVQRWLDADVGREVLWVRLVTDTKQIYPVPAQSSDGAELGEALMDVIEAATYEEWTNR